jgi:hypothetical protein
MMKVEHQNLRYTSRFQGRSLPSWYRLLSGLRMVLLIVLPIINFSSILGTKKTKSRFVAMWLNDLTNCTAGFGLDFLARIINFLRRKQTANFDRDHTLPSYQKNDISILREFPTLLTALRTDGAVLVKSFIPFDVVETIREAIEIGPGTSSDGTAHWTNLGHWMNSGCPGLRFDTDSDYLFGIQEIRKLSEEKSLQHIARCYLGAAPILGPIQSWTTGASPNFSSLDIENAAMAFHCDSDYVKFLKVFVLLTEVAYENGPFQFVVGSHKGPRHVAGRMPDDEVLSLQDDVFLGVGEPGDLIIADTRGWHKATTVKENYRMMLQILFTNSLLGRSTV